MLAPNPLYAPLRPAAGTRTAAFALNRAVSAGGKRITVTRAAAMEAARWVPEYGWFNGPHNRRFGRADKFWGSRRD